MNGSDILTLKRHGGWKSSMVVEGHVDESISDKKRIVRMVQGLPKNMACPVQVPVVQVEEIFMTHSSISFISRNPKTIN